VGIVLLCVLGGRWSKLVGGVSWWDLGCGCVGGWDSCSVCCSCVWG